MRNTWEVESIGFWEREFRWDNTSDPNEFVIRCYIDKGIDKYTKVLIEVFIQGKQPVDPTKQGVNRKVSIRNIAILFISFHTIILFY